MKNKERLLLDNAKAFYLNIGEITISDETYDNLMKELGYTNIDIYEKLNLTKDTNHGFELVQPTLPKAKVNDYNSLPEDESIMINTPKYDGSSIEIIYKDGHLQAILSSSGILQTKKLCNKVPKELNSSITRVYCEAVVDIDKYGDTARQYANGLINSVHKQEEVDDNLYLIAFNCKTADENLTYDQRMQLLSELECSDKFYITTKFFTKDLVDNNPTRYKVPNTDLQVFIDGVVSYSTEDDSKSFINKLYYNEKKSSTIEKIEVNYQNNTDLYSAKLIVKPVKLEGVTIRRISASGNKIKDNRLGRGARIEVFRSGSTIPKNGETIEGSDDFTDLVCKCGTKLSFNSTVGNNFKCTNKNCSTRFSTLKEIHDNNPIVDELSFFNLLRFTGFNKSRIKDSFNLTEVLAIEELSEFMEYIKSNTNLTNSQLKVLELNSIALLKIIKEKYR